MENITLPAPAKINRFLHIIGRRADSYHNLQTAFQFLDLSDQLQFKLLPTSEIILECTRHCDARNDTATQKTEPHDNFTDNNLITRAAKLLQKTTGCGLGAQIQLEKNIPIGAGLGGGSSDAATTLFALNQLWQCGLSQQVLIDLGRQLGADVPIFLHGQAAFASGIGDQFAELNLTESPLVLVAPKVAVCTAEIFNAEDLPRNTPPINLPSLPEWARNDCQALVAKRYPEVAEALDWLNQHSFAQMTGTGAAIFAIVRTLKRAQAIAAQAPIEMSALATETLNKSPMLIAAKQQKAN